MKKLLLVRINAMKTLVDSTARRLSSPALLRAYGMALGVPVLAAALFTAVYLAFFGYGLWQGHAMPSAELYFTLPGIGRLLAGKGHISKFCLAWALLGFCLSRLTRRGALLAPPLEAPLLRPLRILALPLCVSIVLALQGAAVFFTDMTINGGGHTIGGIIPFSDGHGHYSGCLEYFVTGTMPDWVLRRPLSALLNAALLGVCGGNPLASIVLRCVLSGIAIWLLVCAVTRHYGIWSGIVAAGLAIFFVTEHLSTISSEVPGFIWGTAAAALWLESLHSRSLPLELTALGITGLALLTRMGSMFLVPVFALYIVWKWRFHSPDGSARAFPRLCMAVMLVIVLIAVANTRAMRLGHGDTQLTGSNFSYSLLGLSVGKDWSSYKTYENEISGMNPAEYSTFFYRKAIANILDKPQVFLRRLLQGEVAFWKNLPNFLCLSPALLLFICALLAWRWRQGSAIGRGFWLAYWSGVALSIPFIYFDASWRVNIVAYPFMAAFIALTVAMPRRQLAAATVPAPAARYAVCFTALLLTLMAITALCPGLLPVRAAKAAAAHAHLPLAQGENLMLGDINAAGMLVVDDDTPRTPGPVWQISRSALKSFLHRYGIDTYQDLFAANLPETPFAFMTAPGTHKIAIAPAYLLLKTDVLLWKIVFSPLEPGKSYFYTIISAEPIEH